MALRLLRAAPAAARPSPPCLAARPAAAARPPVAAAGRRRGPAPPRAAPSPSLGDLSAQLKAAVASQDFKAAAALKREIEALEAADPLKRLAAELAAAVAAERYAEAARLRDELKATEAARRPPAPAAAAATATTAAAAAPKASGGAAAAAGAAGAAAASAAAAVPEGEAVATTSDAVTRGVRVRVRSYYVRAQSQPALSQHFFAYTVEISNEGESTVHLRSRHWCGRLRREGEGQPHYAAPRRAAPRRPRSPPGRP